MVSDTIRICLPFIYSFFEDPIKQNTFTWTWKANIPDNASPLPSDLSTSTEWCVLVKRHVPPEEDLVEFAGRPFEFDLEVSNLLFSRHFW
jgi:hypothetical protein